MDTYKETFNTWNKLASLYQDKFMHLELYNASYDFICNTITKHNATILEIGCGPGNITKYLLSQRPDFDVLGIDIAPNMISLAKANNPSAKFEVMDARAINEIETTFDGIIAGFCLPYLSPQDANTFIFNTYQLLNKHGCVYLSFVEGNPSQSGFQTASTGDRSYFYYHNLEQLKTQLSSAGFQAFKTFFVEYQNAKKETEIHTILVARKM